MDKENREIKKKIVFQLFNIDKLKIDGENEEYKIEDNKEENKIDEKMKQEMSYFCVCILQEELIIFQRKNSVFILKKKIHQFEPFNECLYLILSVDTFLFTLGVDKEKNNQKTLIKIYDLSKNTFDSAQKVISVQHLNKASDLINKDMFKVTPDLTQLALAFTDGSILLLKSKHLFTEPIKEILDSSSQFQVSDLHFVKNTKSVDKDNSWFIFYNNKKGLFLLGNKKSINEGHFISCSPNNFKGTLFAIDVGANSIVEFNNQGKINNYKNSDENIKQIKCLGKNQIIIVYQDQQQTQLVIQDVDIDYIAFQSQKKGFKSITDIIVLDNILINQQEYSIAFFLGQSQSFDQKQDKQEWSFYKFKEDDNNNKLSKFFNKHQFDIALRFAEYNGASKKQLAEISRMHGDYLYDKRDYENAIFHYLKTTGFIETSYVNRKFLQVQHMNYLIKYLEEIHKNKQQDKHHTAQLLNCYVKQKELEKLEKFIDEIDKDSEQKQDKNKEDQMMNYDQKENQDKKNELFDIKTAIQVCKDLGQNKLALKLAQKNKNHTDEYIQILVEKDKDKDEKIKEALTKLETEFNLSQKVKYIKEYGQEIMKVQPKECLEFIKNLVRLKLAMKNNTNDLNDLKKKFNLLNQDFDVNVINEPNEFINLFYSEKDEEHLKNFLEFLCSQEKLQDKKKFQLRLLEINLSELHKLMQKKAPSKNRQTSPYEDEDVRPIVEKINQLQQDIEQQGNNYKNNNSQIDEYQNQLLILFKMYKYDDGIIKICTKMSQTDELLHHYMNKNESENIKLRKMIKLCEEKKQGDLYIQTLKYILKLYCYEQGQSEKDKIEFIQLIMKEIQNKNDLSPLMILDIIQNTYIKNKSQNIQQIQQKIKFKDVKEYFKKKTEAILNVIKEDNKVVQENIKQQKKIYDEYKKLMTEAQSFQGNKCQICDGKLQNPSIHFRCEHSFDESCVYEDNYNNKECSKCCDDNKIILQRRLNFKQNEDNQSYDKDFQEIMKNNNNKRENFDIISDFMGKGIFNKKGSQNFNQNNSFNLN